MRTLLQYGLLMLLCGLAFDFRGSGTGGPSFVQYLFLLIAESGAIIVTIVGLTISGGRIMVGTRFGLRVLCITIAYCAWAPVALIVSSDTAHDDFTSVILPYCLYAQTMLAVLIALQSGVSERLLIRLLIIVSAVSCGWRLIYAVTFTGVELSAARWQILSPALPLILGASVAALNTRSNRPLAIFGMIYFLGIVTLSVTRSYLVALAFVLAATVVTTRGRGRALIAPRALGRMAVLVISVVASLAVLTLVLPPEVNERWVSRLGGEKADGGEEITLLYRLAQFKGQYDALTSNVSSLIAGRGFGANFVFDEGLLSSLSFIAPDEVVESTNGSDSTWGYPIFAHGIILGPLFLGTFLAAVLASVGTARALRSPGVDAFPAYFVCFSLVALLGISLTGNIFSERLGGVMIGALVALMLRHQSKCSSPSGSTTLEGSCKDNSLLGSRRALLP